MLVLKELQDVVLLLSTVDNKILTVEIPFLPASDKIYASKR